MESLNRKIPIPTIKRFPQYLRILKVAKEGGCNEISATKLATELSLKPIQVRKDISSTGIEGKPKRGFSVDELILVLTHYLGWDNISEAIIVGAGNLGKALATYPGFETYGLKIVAIFDRDKEKWWKRVGSLTVLPMEDLNAYISTNRISIAVMATPASTAQSVADMLIKCGIRGIWNFAPKTLKVPNNVVVQRTDLATSFAVLSVKMRKLFQEESGEEINLEELS